MASKRMFSLSVIDTDVFLEMPTSAQALYFHLCLRADDDGFVGNSKRICRTVGANEDDLKLLIAKRFLLTFDDGVIVIKHWRMHNTLSRNRYYETKYLEDKALLKINKNKAYTFSDEGVPIDDTKLIESSDRQADAQKTNERRTKDAQKTTTEKKRIEKNRKEENRIEKKSKEEKKHEKYFDCELLNDAFEEFAKMRKIIKKPLTERATTLLINKLNELSGGDDSKAIEIVNQSILNSWQSFYPLSEKNGCNKKNGINRDTTAEEISEIEKRLLQG